MRTTVVWNDAYGRVTLRGALTPLPVTPPPTEPLTVGQALAHLRWTTGHPESGSLPSWISTARSLIERETGTGLVAATWDLTLESTTVSAPAWFTLPVYPVRAVVRVETLSAGTATLVDPSSYRVDVAQEPAVFTFNSLPAGDQIRIRYATGYDSVAEARAAEGEAHVPPPELIHAIKLIVADLASHRGDEREPWLSPTLPMGVSALCWRFKLPTVP